MQYDTIMGMLFYEFQNVLEVYSSILEERKEDEEREYEENEMSPSNYTPDKMMRTAQKYMSKVPQMSNISTPKIDIPKF